MTDEGNLRPTSTHELPGLPDRLGASDKLSAQNKLKKIVQLYYGFQLFFSLLVWLPIFYEYQKHFGLNDQQIFSIQSLYYLAFCLLEIPTGLVADVWGYRRCLRAGAVTLVLTHLFPIFLPTYAGFLLHFMGIALSRSLISGASSAYLYEHLKPYGATEHFRVFEGKARAYGLVAKVVAWATVGAVMDFHITLPYWITLFAALISTVFAWLLPPAISNGSTMTRSQLNLSLLTNRLSTTFVELKKSPYLIFLIGQGIAIFVLGRIIQVNLFQPILSGKNLALTYHGGVMAAMTLFEAFGSGYPQLLRNRMSNQTAVFWLSLLLGVSLLLIPVLGVWGVIFDLCLFALFSGFAYPIQKQLFNDSIKNSDYRATLLSIESIVDRAACAWVATLLGQVMSAPSGLDRFLVVTGLVTIATMAGLYWLSRRQGLHAK